MTQSIVSDTALLDMVRALRHDGRSPKDIARILGARPSEVSRLIRAVAIEDDALAHDGADDLAAVGELVRCSVSPDWHNELLVDGHPEWPRDDGVARGSNGLATVLVARARPREKVSVCTFLVDTQCLGVKETIGPRTMSRDALARFERSVFGGYGRLPLDCPIDLACHLVFGAVEYARGLGFEPAKDFARCEGHLGQWSATRAITFGRFGKPVYVSGPFDDVQRVLRTLERSVGPGGYDFVVHADQLGSAVLAG
ncbi:MAG: helix-turn-helix domain-containing protein [Actinomycetota bacterium]|nr:helix-turn-helix domain-containing protein [Actinomycetota bacterium]